MCSSDLQYLENTSLRHDPPRFFLYTTGIYSRRVRLRHVLIGEGQIRASARCRSASAAFKYHREFVFDRAWSHNPGHPAGIRTSQVARTNTLMESRADGRNRNDLNSDG